MEPNYIDIHAHVNFQAFDSDRQEVIERAKQANTWMINVGTQKDTSRMAVEIAEKYDEGVYAIVGLHPVHTTASYHDEKELGEGGKEFTSRGEVFDYEYYKKLLMHPKTVALGECGLDYYRLEEDSIALQKKAFIEQIHLANDVSKPLMLHIRNAYADALEILKAEAGSKTRGDVHFFAGTWQEAKAYLDFGFTLSFTGVITFADQYDEVIKNTPLDMIMSETDCPYITPAPFRGRRNEPMHVSLVVEKIALLKGLPLETVRAQLVKNAKRVFNL